MIDKLYQNEAFKKIYTYTLCGFTILTIIIIPLFTRKNYLFSSILIDYSIRAFIVLCACQMINGVAHIKESYQKFYSGAKNLVFEEADTFTRIINIFTGLLTGIGMSALYYFAFNLFAAYLGKLILVISILIGSSISILQVSQSKIKYF